MSKLVAYKLDQVKTKLTLSHIKQWYSAKLIDETTWLSLKEAYKTELYSPKVFMRILLFIGTLIGLLTILGPVFLIIEPDNDEIQVLLIVIGILILVFTELNLIKANNHYKSGVNEAGYYVGLIFLYTGALIFGNYGELVYITVAMIIFSLVSVRYMDLVSLAFGMYCIIPFLFEVFSGFIEWVPFIIMTVFTCLYLGSEWLKPKLDSILWEDHLILFQSISLFAIFLGGNYLVVRELSIEMMHLRLEDGEDIPYALLFYITTALIPLFYLGWGIRQKSLLFIRVGLLTIALGVGSIKYYYHSDQPVITICLIGGLLIITAVGLMKYLKKPRNGYMRDLLLTSKRGHADLAAFLASQTLGGHAIDQQQTYDGKGGEFGGAGATGEF